MISRLKIISIFLFLFAAASTDAQLIPYLQPQFGAGITYRAPLSYNKESKIANNNYMVGLGVKKDDWRFEAGLRYFGTGYTSQVGNYWGAVSTLSLTTWHLSIPLSVSFEIPVMKRLSIVPGFGINFCYNTLMTYKSDTISRTVTGSEFEAHESRISIMGTVRLNVEYHLNKELSMFAGVMLDRHFKDLLSHDKDYVGINTDGTNSRQVNAGIVYSFIRPEQKKVDEQKK